MPVQSIAGSLSRSRRRAHSSTFLEDDDAHQRSIPPKGLFKQLGISMMVSLVLVLFAAIKEYSRLYVKEVFLYKKDGFIAHEFLVFALHDRKATYENKPLVYILNRTLRRPSEQRSVISVIASGSSKGASSTTVTATLVDNATVLNLPLL